MTTELAARLQEKEQVYQRRLGQKEELERQLAETQEGLQKLTTRIETLEQVQVLFQKAAEESRELGRAALEAAARTALQYVYGNSRTVHLALGESRGRPEAQLLVGFIGPDGEERLTNPGEDEEGGGVINVLSLALRMAILELFSPPLVGPLLLDEPTSMVSVEESEHVTDFLKEVARSTGRQVLLVTHSPELAAGADRQFQVVMVDGISEIRPL